MFPCQALVKAETQAREMAAALALQESLRLAVGTLVVVVSSSFCSFRIRILQERVRGILSHDHRHVRPSSVSIGCVHPTSHHVPSARMVCVTLGPCVA